MLNEIMTTTGANVPAAELSKFESFSGGLFQAITTCSTNRNERKVRIAQINAELTAYLAKEENNLKLKSGGMALVQQTFEGQLNKAELTFEERKELLNTFSGIILKIIGC